MPNCKPALALCAGLAVFPTAAAATAASDAGDTIDRNPAIVVTGHPQATPVSAPPATHAAVDAEQIANTINAVSVEDTLKYLPSLVIRKRHIGDAFAPIATRTSGLGASARSLIYADGALLSALIANNNGNGSPRWSLVAPEEIERIDVTYGPFSAAYPGNSIGATVEIKTRQPDRLEARATALTNVQTFALYGTDKTLPTTQFSASLGDRFGPLALFASVTRTRADSQPVSFTTLAGTSDPAGSSGGTADRNKLGQPIRVLGAGGLEHHLQYTAKFKAALDLAPGVRGQYVLGVWSDDSRGDVETYLNDASGAPSYRTAASGTTTGFNAAVYSREALHFSHALSLTGSVPGLDWQVIGTLYRYARDWQSNPSPDTATGTSAATGFIAARNDLPAALLGGPGTIQKQDGTGWATLDAKASIRLGAAGRQVLSLGAHADRETLAASTISLADWRNSSSALGQLRSASLGHTRTLAIWAQDVVPLVDDVTLTLGARYEWWRAYGGLSSALTPTVNSSVVQPERHFAGASPKAALEWRASSSLSLRLSAGQAWRMPTVGELYQTSTVGTLLANPNPGLLPERARSFELALEHRVAKGSLRLSLFDEVVDNALISQLDAASGTTFVQNVERTRARGAELAIERRDVLPRLDLAASLTYADPITARDPVFPAAVGKLLPSVPHWKGNMVLTWRATPRLTVTSAARFASRNYANLANDDVVGQTYQGFYRYVVVDLRARLRLNDHIDFALGVDNLNNDKYFLFHPFPQRSYTAQLDWKL